MENENERCDLILGLQIVTSAVAGYGKVLDCEVISVKRGLLADKKIRIIIFPSGKKMDAIFGSSGTMQLEIGFIKKNSNEPHYITPSNGFIDSKRTTWEIVYSKIDIQQ